VIAPEDEDLIQASIDGALDAPGRARLAERMLSDPEIRRRHEQFKRLAFLMDGLAPAQLPEGFAAHVHAAVQQAPAHNRQRLPQHWGWRLAASLAGVVLVGAVVVAVIGGNRPSSEEVAGTLSPHSGKVLDTVQVGGGALSGRVTLTREGDALSLLIDLQADAPISVLVVSGEHTLTLEGVGRQQDREARRVALPGFSPDVATVNLTFLVEGKESGGVTLRAAAASR
jgi:hypothetical protein